MNIFSEIRYNKFLGTARRSFIYDDYSFTNDVRESIRNNYLYLNNCQNTIGIYNQAHTSNYAFNTIKINNSENTTGIYHNQYYLPNQTIDDVNTELNDKSLAIFGNNITIQNSTNSAGLKLDLNPDIDIQSIYIDKNNIYNFDNNSGASTTVLLNGNELDNSAFIGNIGLNINSVSYDPLYDPSTNDFHLLSNSPLNNQFINDIPYDLQETNPVQPFVDFDNDLRVSCITIGADEIDPQNYLKAKLEAVMTTTQFMSTQLNSYDLIPSNQPYNYFPINYAGNESVSTFQENCIDWVLVEAKDENCNTVARKAFLIDNEGFIKNHADCQFSFDGLAPGNYYFKITLKFN